MFEKYLSNEQGFGLIDPALTTGEVRVMESGQVFHNGVEITPSFDEMLGWVVSVNTGGVISEIPVALLVLAAFGKLRLGYHHWWKVEPFHIDGNWDNLHPSNIGYRYRWPIECDFSRGRRAYGLTKRLWRK
jgi:hypothetical protein